MLWPYRGDACLQGLVRPRPQDDGDASRQRIEREMIQDTPGTLDLTASHVEEHQVGLLVDD
ncbi:MAG TPA: hypothetical protein VK898_12960, partial [Chloroflexota bacterium]|nr:hypothetical protein [Chloroflexota bacterium]